MNDASHLASLAGSLQRRMEALFDDVDPSWHEPLGLPSWPAAVEHDAARSHLSNALVRLCCGALPPLAALTEGAGPLALHGRQQLLSRLCALALLGRPGVLRCCIERQARTALQRNLGPAYAALNTRSAGAAPVRADVAAWTPVAWAWVGYRELVHAHAWPHRSLRRLARLALPVSRHVAPAPRLVPAAISRPTQRLAELEALYHEGAPC